MHAPALPVDAVLPALRDALAAHAGAVLQAPPGAGKTTRVPLALLGEDWLAGRRILVLEPRRLAARAAAHHMARRLGEPVGATVGYRVRLDTRTGPATRVEVVTEGVLPRLLRDDPALEATGLVVFDEFHERSLDADLGLALCRQVQQLLRPDLRLLVMSATLDDRGIAALLGDVPVVRSEGRAWPVETRHRPAAGGAPTEREVAAVVREALAHDRGDLLVFLPGAREIDRTAALLAAPALPAEVDLHRLHGALPLEEQDRAIAPAPPGRRKVVLASAIAETSLTIEGVRVVVDAGWARVPRHSPARGLTRLATVRVSRASADQRRGRAGRTAPGVCYRLWAAHEEASLRPFERPEILEADLAPLALELAAAGVGDPAELAWLDPPPAPALGVARALLRDLGALDADGRVTAHGRAMAELPAHPRLAHMLLRAEALGHAALACDLAALLEERDPLRGDGRPPDADLRLRLELLAGRGVPARHRGHVVDRAALQRVRELARHWRQRRRAGTRPADADAAGVVLGFAYPDRLAQRRAGDECRYLLRSGAGASLPAAAAFGGAPFVAIAALDGRAGEARIALAAPLAEDELLAHHADQLQAVDLAWWDDGPARVTCRRQLRLGALVLRDGPQPSPDPAVVRRALLAHVRERGLGALPWTDGARRLRERLAFLHALDAGWPDQSDAALLADLEAWLAPALRPDARDLGGVDLEAALRARLTWPQRAQLDELAPTHVTVPSGSRIAVDYGAPAAPVLAVKLQEVFGWEASPRVGGGRVPLTLHLLSPAGRPVQVTRDLAGFWRTSYFDVRKAMRGRYPRHDWPEDPLAAVPHRGRKPRP